MESLADIKVYFDQIKLNATSLVFHALFYRIVLIQKYLIQKYLIQKYLI